MSERYKEPAKPASRRTQSTDPATQADAIVVLGCRLRPDGAPTPALLRRVRLAVQLYNEGAAPALLLSGGGPHPVSEAEMMRQLALAAGTSASAILVETTSGNTAENAF